ncbi:MAG: asparagine synthase-related protein, partial [Gemmatimonadota bacterium]|nr:asparagine synthase-related protein [Gemmatimonadota bacterium]
MSGVLGVFERGGEGPDAPTVRTMLAGLVRRGTESEVRRGDFDGAALAVTRHTWELDEGFSGPVLVAAEGSLFVAADATLYYQHDLLRKLDHAGVRVSGRTASHLILAAYRAWGERCAEELEGDFAFILWDGNRRRVVCARDFGGKRPLFYAQLGSSLAIASTVSALLGHPRCPDEFDLTAVGADASGLFAAPSETAYRAISQLPAGCTLVGQSDRTRVARHWKTPVVHERGGPGFVEAAGELRRLLQSAVAERLAPSGPTSVWLSGGWDSTAVFGAGEQVLRERGSDRHLQAISISFPPGDVGREDELILAVAKHWGSPVRWLDITEIPLLDRPLAAAAARDQPFAHAFESGNRALAAGS